MSDAALRRALSAARGGLEVVWIRITQGASLTRLARYGQSNWGPGVFESRLRSVEPALTNVPANRRTGVERSARVAALHALAGLWWARSLYANQRARVSQVAEGVPSE